MKISRRLFLKDSGLALASVGLAPALGPMFLRQAAFAQERDTRQAAGAKTLICIFQRGAVDGLSMVVPHGDPHYYQHRQSDGAGIAIAATGANAIIDLDGTFGLHPALAALKPIYDAGHFAPIHACGSPNASRSHFDAQDYMETAAPGDSTVKDGWLARTISHCPQDQAHLKSLFRGVAMTSYVPLSFEGDSAALAIPNLRTFGLTGSAPQPRRRVMADGSPNIGFGAMSGVTVPTGSVAAGFEAMYDHGTGDTLHGTGKETFEALRTVRKLNAANYRPEGGADYPRTPFGTSLQQIAQLIKANVGLEVAFAEVGGWDTHVRQGGAQGTLANRLQELGKSLAALYTDLGDRMADVTILTMSEFGRTVRQNGNGGTDHGHATCFLALGGNVNGGKVLGQWPGLAPEQLHENRDLAVTTDFRDVFGEIANRHLGVTDLAALFPAYQSSPSKFRGVMRA